MRDILDFKEKQARLNLESVRDLQIETKKIITESK